MNRPPDALIGQTIDRYLIQALIGRGGFGAVYRAVHSVTGRAVAIKVLHEKRLVDPTILQRFIREAQITTAIGHPGIVDVLDAGTTPDGTPFLVMELLAGVSLREYIKAGAPFAEAEAVALGQQVLSALSAAHNKGIIHRDVKPDNIFVTEVDGELRTKLLDFGVSKVARSVDKLTGTGVTIGSPYYMPPEQFMGGTVSDQRADLYSVAAVLYEMLSGTPPFGEEDEIQRLIARLNDQAPKSLAARNPSVPGPLAEVIDRCLSRDPDGRFPNADSFAEALSAAQKGERPPQPMATLASEPVRAPAPTPQAIHPTVQSALQPAVQQAAPQMGPSAPSAAPVSTEQPKQGSSSRVWLAVAAVVGAIIAGLSVFIVLQLVRPSDDDSVEPDLSNAELTSPPEVTAQLEPMAPTMVEVAPPSPTEIDPPPTESDIVDDDPATENGESDPISTTEQERPPVQTMRSARSPIPAPTPPPPVTTNVGPTLRDYLTSRWTARCGHADWRGSLTARVTISNGRVQNPQISGGPAEVVGCLRSSMSGGAVGAPDGVANLTVTIDSMKVCVIQAGAPRRCRAW